MSVHRPFDDLIDLIKQLVSSSSANGDVRSVAQNANEETQTEIASLMVWLGHHQKASKPTLNESHICIFVSSYEGQNGTSLLKKFTENAGRGQEPVSKLCKERGVGLRILEMAPEVPHVVSKEWPENQCMAAIGFGMEAAAASGDILGLAALAPGNEYYCKCLIESVITDLKQLPKPLNEGNAFAVDTLNMMKNEAGREVAAMVGAIIAARSCQLPVLVEGWSGIAAMCVLKLIAPSLTNHIRVASIECAEQAAIIKILGVPPIIGGFVNLGPGCGIALAHSVMASMLNLKG